MRRIDITMNDILTIALPKGKLFAPAAAMLAQAGLTAVGLCDSSRKLVIEGDGVRFIIAKTADVPTYVEYGAADLGVIGKDVLAEARRDVCELLDLGFGRCHLMMAVPEDTRRPALADYAHTRVATKFPHLAKRFFDAHGMQMEYVPLGGSIELGPIVGLAESIVDLVETGTTLRENHLVEVSSIMDSTARLIANRVSFRLKFARLSALRQRLLTLLA